MPFRVTVKSDTGRIIFAKHSGIKLFDCVQVAKPESVNLLVKHDGLAVFAQVNTAKLKLNVYLIMVSLFSGKFRNLWANQ